jgi:dienelactone hydrolase
MADRLVIDRRPVGSSRPPERLVVFFHGFMTTPTSYRTVLGALADERTVVVAPRMYRPGPAVLAGHPTATQEAAAGVSVVDEVRQSYGPEELWLAGHSRGGQVAWIVARDTAPDGVIVVDPVDGGGRRSARLNATAEPATFASRTLVIGAGSGGRCAPDPVDHRHFAVAAPPGATHVVVDDMGHADLLDDRPRRAARLLCPGHIHPDLARRTVVELMRAFLDGAPPPSGATPVAFEVC